MILVTVVPRPSGSKESSRMGTHFLIRCRTLLAIKVVYYKRKHQIARFSKADTLDTPLFLVNFCEERVQRVWTKVFGDASQNLMALSCPNVLFDWSIGTKNQQNFNTFKQLLQAPVSRVFVETPKCTGRNMMQDSRPPGKGDGMSKKSDTPKTSRLCRGGR